MTWSPLLLADPSPCLRLRVLRDLLGRPDDDPEVLELFALRLADPLARRLAETQNTDGSWTWRDVGGPERGDRLQPTAFALMQLGCLGFGPDDPMVERGAGYLWDRQAADGSWPLSHRPDSERGEEAHEGYSMIPLQTALPLRGLAACGCATDARSERAYEWLLAQRLDDGAWPTGYASGSLGYVAGYRRLAHSRWGCRANTTGALACLALHPTRRYGDAARRALDLLLGCDLREEHTLGFEVARLAGAEAPRGFITFYARFDAAQVLDLCWRIGVGLADDRVATLVAFARQVQGSYGLWQYVARPQASRWVSFDLLRSLDRLEGQTATDPASGWVGEEPRTPFQRYVTTRRRY